MFICAGSSVELGLNCGTNIIVIGNGGVFRDEFVDVVVCVRAYVRACVCVCHNEKKCQTNGKHDKRHRRYFK